MAKRRKNIVSSDNLNINENLIKTTDDSPSDGEVAVCDKNNTDENQTQNKDKTEIETQQNEQISTDEMVFSQNQDGTYSIKNTEGEKIFDDTVKKIKRDDSKIQKRKMKDKKKDDDFEKRIDDDKAVQAKIENKKKHHFKLSKKERERIYEKKTFSKKMKTLAILLVLGVFTGSGLGVWYFNVALRSTVDYDSMSPSDYIQDVGETLKKNFNISSASDRENWVAIAKSQGKSPADLSAADNFVLAQYNTSLAKSFVAVGNGNVNTLGMKQSVYSSKRYDGNKYTFESISKGVLSVAICDSYIKNSNKVSIYSGSNINSNGTDATWNFDKDITTDEYKSLTGNLPTVVQPYIVSEKTILSSTDMTYENGLYTFTLNLDPITSVLNYVYQVKRTGGLSALPEFKELSQTIVIDDNWNLISIDVTESYSAVAFGMKVSCSGTLKTTYTYDCDVEFPV